jgi:hypothetical protein
MPLSLERPLLARLYDFENVDDADRHGVLAFGRIIGIAYAVIASQRANARPIINSAKQSIAPPSQAEEWIASA